MTNTPVFKDMDVDGGAAFRVYDSSRELVRHEVSEERDYFGNSSFSRARWEAESGTRMNSMIKLIEPDAARYGRRPDTHDRLKSKLNAAGLGVRLAVLRPYSGSRFQGPHMWTTARPW